MKKLDRAFYNRDSVIVAGELLGKVLVHQTEGQRISARITETEAYMGIEDKAAHSYGGRRTARVEVMYGEAGFSYIFMIYGMYYCFNIVTNERENPQAVLIRAVEPLEGIEQMAQRRFGKQYEQLTNSRKIGLANGPGKLCGALAIDRRINGMDLCGNEIYVEDAKCEDLRIVTSKRIGIDYAEEAKDYPWRFYIEGSKYVSVK
ncbi:DNA-3-methyladenine glycosylase [Ruminiclostridium sufflavum DSM 19573]|uniref:Putative 3-methyladenine DNA glycosylase n=1 Tax=Ruminiclostridium sufflavum DSM 19573 TaxID=1121337 RepID=A0A318XPN6_9FIRM|nr:DNA-3-methyladenine glycosylase [Ruminiclostridium sufflavum]PYG90281.1 DNA-3-methyladenine glycosylase [Ruminiclostridium sufflavum DSM 19573]